MLLNDVGSMKPVHQEMVVTFSTGIDDEIEADENYINFRNMIQIYNTAGMLEFCKDLCNRKYLSM